MIKKLNALFHKHSRILFGAFTLLIIVAFTDFLTPGNIGGCSSDNTIGTAFGEKVSAKELADFGHKLAGKSGRLPDIAELFNYYCIIKRAEQMGITVSAQEIAREISANPMFAKNGKFDQETFNTFLKNNQLSSDDLAETIKIQLMMQKLSLMIAQNITVSDNEIENFYRTNNGKFTLKIAQFDAQNSKVAAATDAQLQEFYNANKAKYIVKGSYEALLMEVPFTAFKAAAEKAVTADDVKAAAASGEYVGFDGKALSNDMIKQQLIARKGMELTQNFAQKLFRQLYQESAKATTPKAQLEIFRAFAAKHKLLVTESGKVDFDSQLIAKKHLPNICASLQNMPMEGLRLTQQENNHSGCNIAILKTRTAPQQLDFKAAKGMVTADRNKQKQLEAARLLANTESAKFAKMDKKSAAAAFDKIAGVKFIDLTLPPDEKTPFDREKIMLLQSVAGTLAEMTTGDISKAINNDKGALIVKVVKRAPADMSKFASQKEMIKGQIAMMKQELAVKRFFDEISKNCSLISREK